MQMLLLPDCIPSDVWADTALGLLDARDLMRLPLSLAAFPSGAAFVASRVLDKAELAWFASHAIPVELLAEVKVDPQNGDRSWHLNGSVHRAGGLPAIERINGERVWADNDRGGIYKVVDTFGNVARLKDGKWHSDGDLPANEWGATKRREWREKGQLHRDGDLPAVEDINGMRQWWVHGKQHRECGLPAVERADGSREWYAHGKRHRDSDLPAIERADGTREWWVHGKRHRGGDLPAIVVVANGEDGQRYYWFCRDQYSNEPPFELASGDCMWLVNGKLHRECGLPAVERADGRREWWVNGTRIT